jgi:replicative DNA helicase
MPSDILQKVPPHSLDAEVSCLGAMLLDKEAAGVAIENLRDDFFYKEAHRHIFLALQDLFDKNEPTDLITLTDILKKKKLLEAVGGASYISSIIDAVPSSASIEYYTQIIAEKASLRKLIEASNTIITSCFSEGEEVKTIIDEAEQSIFDIGDRHISQSFVSAKEVLRDSIKAIEQIYNNKGYTGIPTGYKKLDEMLTGVQNSDLIIVAARPSMGKTAFCLNIAENIAIQQKKTVGVFSLEMSKDQLVRRLLCSISRIDSNTLRKGFLKESDWPALTNAASKLSEAPIFIDDSASLTILEVRAKARRLKAKHNLGVLIIDYLQLITVSRTNISREQEIATISRSLKGLAKELDIPVIALSQLSRAVESRTDKRPMLSDLRESGSIEQDADVVMFLYRDDYYNKDNSDKQGIIEILVRKQRNGPTGEVELAFIKDYGRFENLSHTTD